MQFSAAATALSEGKWLTVTPASGSSTSANPAAITVKADPTGLAAGQYFGTVTITAPGNVDSPELIDVVLTVGPGSGGSALITPGSLAFSAPAVGDPVAQGVQFVNLTTGTLAVTATPVFNTSTAWFGVSSPSASLTAGQTLSETLQVSVAGLAAGTYSGTLDFHVAQPAADYFVPVLLVVPQSQAAPSIARPGASAAAVAACTATQLLPVFTNLTGGFTATAGIPVSVQVSIADDCGNPLTAGQVAMYFPGSGDADVAMQPLGSGQWAGTWMPHNSGGGDAEIGVESISSSPTLVGSAGLRGTVAANASTPIVSPGGVVSAASVAVGGPLPIAPGEFISIFGSNFTAAGASGAATPAYPVKLVNVQAMLGGEAMPLQVAAGTQINAVVPYDAPVGSTQQVMVQWNGVSQSALEPVVIAAAQPSIFTQNQTGSGAGAILTVNATTGAVSLNSPSAPASAGDVLEVYCTGLGAVDPPVPAGQAAPLDKVSQTVNTVTATLGGQTAMVQFTGLAPGYAGLYQVNVMVPAGLTPGSAVPLVLSEAGAVSPPVTVAIQ
jgi:uncharacterized protein (TIGR03437 family)